MFQSRNWKRLAKYWKTSTSHSAAKMDTAGIATAVMVGAQRAGVRVGNDDLAKVAATTPDRIICVASVDPVEFGAEDQFLFGSSYPFRPMKQGVEDFQCEPPVRAHRRRVIVQCRRDAEPHVTR